MKFKIEVELAWVGEEGNLDDEIQKAIVDKVVSSVSKGITEQVQKEASATITPKVNELVEKTYEELVAGKVVLTDKWGDKKHEYPSIKELIKARWDEWLAEIVDDRGNKSDGYTRGHVTERVNFLVKNQIEAFSKEWTKKVLEEITNNIKKTLSDDLKVALGERVMDVIDIKSLVAKSKE